MPERWARFIHEENIRDYSHRLDGEPDSRVREFLKKVLEQERLLLASGQLTSTDSAVKNRHE